MVPLRPPAPAGPTYPADLSLFSGTPANGTWSLFIDDQVGGDDGQVFGGWSLNVTAPVNTLTAGKPKLNKKKGTAQIPVTVGDAGQLSLSGKGVKTRLGFEVEGRCRSRHGEADRQAQGQDREASSTAPAMRR